MKKFLKLSDRQLGAGLSHNLLFRTLHEYRIRFSERDDASTVRFPTSYVNPLCSVYVSPNAHSVYAQDDTSVWCSGQVPPAVVPICAGRRRRRLVREWTGMTRPQGTLV